MNTGGRAPARSAHEPACVHDGRETVPTLDIEPHRFAIVPEWLLDACISDCAVRLYVVLLRYGHSSGQRMPSRALLARRLKKGSTDTVDRALKELVALGAVVIEHRRDGTRNLTNRYHVRTSGPLPAGTPAPGRTSAASRTVAPTWRQDGSRGPAATPGRNAAAEVTARMRPDPEHLTHTSPPPPDRSAAGSEVEAAQQRRIAAQCGVPDLQVLARRCQDARQTLGASTARWTASCITAAIRLALHRGWHAELVAPALLAVAGDPASRSPMRLAEAGPWWDEADNPVVVRQPEADTDDGVAECEARLDALDGGRVALQREARQSLASQGRPVTRASVLHEACRLLAQRQETLRAPDVQEAP